MVSSTLYLLSIRTSVPSGTFWRWASAVFGTRTHREYAERAVDRVILIQELYAAGLHSRKIAELLPCMRDPDGGPNERATPELVTELTAERDRIDRLIADLTTSRAVLTDVITAAARDLPTS